MLSSPFELNLNKEDRVIRGDVYLPFDTGSFPVVLICHGFKGFKNWAFFPTLARRLAQAGLAAIAFNFSMNGIGPDLENFTELDKFARLTFSREQEDIAFLLEQLKQGNLPHKEAIDTGRIGIMGHSRGGGNSLIFALDHPEIRAVAIWNSIHRPDFFDPDLIAEIKEKGRGTILNARTGQKLPIDREVLDDIEANRDRFAFLNRLSELHCPLLIVQGDQDLPGFLEGARQMAELAPNATLRVIPGANHTFGSVHPFAGITPQLEKALQATAAFFQEKLQ
jgi:pimeloyl-ACP methyl ester carboxylesterase